MAKEKRMSLEIESDFKIKKDKILYKVMRKIDDDTYQSEMGRDTYEALFGGDKYKKGKTYKKKYFDRVSYEKAPSVYYSAGFHCYNKLQDAFDTLTCVNLVVVKVRIGKILAKGLEGGREVVVTDSIKILEEVNEKNEELETNINGI